MTEPAAIDPDPPANPGLDYAVLREEGTRIVQQLSSAVWTDYNEHDPGVTTLEQLCYALTELSYRAELPLEDLLVSPRTGRIDPRRQALFVPRRILPCNPVTADDYRKLVVDRVPGVVNAWFVPRPSPPAAVGGLYDVFVYAPGAHDCPPTGAAGAPDEVRAAVRRVYARHRALCEDLGEVVVLGASPVVVGGDVELEEARDADVVLARVLFQVSLVLAPELHRSSLTERLQAGLPPSRIFEGPLMRNGFVTDDQLTPLPRTVAVSAVARAIVRTAGVAGAARVTVTDPLSGRVYRRDQRVPVPERTVLQAETRPDRRTGRFALRLTKNGVPYPTDPARVQRELDRLFAAWRQTVPLGPQYDEWFAFPQGQPRDVASYFSIQEQYPNVYGINAYGLPSGATAARRAQARQFKGYLLTFEQLLADFFAQLAHVRDLFSLDRRTAQTYFWQYLDRSVPDVEPLLRRDGPGYHEGLPLLVRAMDPVAARRNGFLEFLLSLYGESLTPDDLAGAADGEALVAARLALLRRLVPATHDRGRGVDVLAPASLRNVAGLTIRCRIQLGMDPYDDRPLGDLLDELALELVESEASATFGRTLARHADHIQARFAAAGEPAASGAGEPLRGLALTEAAIAAGARASHYRLGRLPGESEVALVCGEPSTGEWRLVGKYRDEAEAQAAQAALVPALDRLARRCRQLYVVEHVLLRFADADPEERPAAAALDETFTLTAVLSDAPDAAGRRFAREVLRTNTPAHVAVGTLFLGACALRRFETLYWAWRDALRGGDERERARTSRRLRRFLEDAAEREAA